MTAAPRRQFANGGWSFACNPDLSPIQAPAIWRPDLAPATLALDAVPHAYENLPSVDIEASGLVRRSGDADDGRHLIIAASEGDHRLWVRTRPGTAMAVVLPIDDAFDLRLGAALDRLQSTTIATSIRQTNQRRRHRFSWINEWKERLDDRGRPLGIEMIVPDWFYAGVLDQALVLTIDRQYFSLTGGLERWLYRIVRKHGGKQSGGWSFDVSHLHLKSGVLSPLKQFAFDLRAIVAKQPLPGYTLALETAYGRERLSFIPIPVDPLEAAWRRFGLPVDN